MSVRNRIEEEEERRLAPYATKSRESRGRKHEEPPHEYRVSFQRDRDRIIHSAAFRALQYKTQVFVIHEADFYRTRLTHTLEVMQISRILARSLGANEDLVEAIALAHDIGHPPFGHAGEEELQTLMKDKGGFDHNLQSLRIVDATELRYPDFPGLNLSWETREGLARHETRYDEALRLDEFPESQPGIETQIVNVADEIAYSTHDLDDALTLGFITEEGLEKESDSQLWRQAYEAAGQDLRANRKLQKTESSRLRYRRAVRNLIEGLSKDVLVQAPENIDKYGIDSPAKVRSLSTPVVAFSENTYADLNRLSEYIKKTVFSHSVVLMMLHKARKILRELFNTFAEHAELLPEELQERSKTENIYRIVCDYIAGMTDRYAMDMYDMLFEPYERTLTRFGRK
ncbi:MAG: deoxyguanosinetriphosphate triphosphohydrolase [Gemmatimonadota bacterium]|nr:MAG: deoxyguanosinetriphosphate triphosphohydrolase [Gemmatimonadota bacterium]